MTSRERCSWLALALGPCPTRQGLLQSRAPLEELEAWWLHREAFASWPRGARSLEELLDRIQLDEERLASSGSRSLLAFEADYPAALAGWPQAPALLWLSGQLPAAPMLALVGSRAASQSGLQKSGELAAGVAAAGYVVISGGALGIDAAAHQGALEAGGLTIAVLGNGLDRLYPERNLPLFARVAARGGVLTPYPPGTPPRRWHFHFRNHLMARLGRLVVVVEAAARSGALVTARFARALGRPVLACPAGAGARRLLTEGAGLVDGAADVIAVLEGGAPRLAPTTPADPDAARALTELRCGRDLSVEELASRLGWRVARAAASLLRLELAGLAELRPGGRYAGGAGGGDPEQEPGNQEPGTGNGE